MVYQTSNELYVGISLISLLRSLDFFLQNSIRAHVRNKAFATLKIELNRVVDYDSKLSNKFHRDCMLEILKISLLRRIFFFKIVLVHIFDTELLSHSKLN